MMKQGLIKKMELKFSAHFIGLFLLTGYISFQLHELGHWLTASLLNANIVLGFDKWQFLSSPEGGAMMLVFAAGPIVSLLLSFLGIALLHHSEKPFLRSVGLTLAIFNPLLMIGSVAFGSGTRANYDLSSSEYPWKVLLLPAFAVLVLLGLKSLKESFSKTVKRSLVLLVLSLSISLPVVVIDEAIVWPGIEAGNPVFTPVFGISAPVILVNTAAFVGFVLICKRGLAGRLRL